MLSSFLVAVLTRTANGYRKKEGKEGRYLLCTPPIESIIDLDFCPKVQFLKKF